MKREEGFTLIEALVALAIVAVAAAGLIRAAEGGIDRVRGLELRSAARWVAENRLAELQAMGERTSLPQGVRMLDHDWQVAVRITNSQDRDIRQAVVTVRPATGNGPTVTLRGFVDAGTVSP